MSSYQPEHPPRPDLTPEEEDVAEEQRDEPDTPTGDPPPGDDEERAVARSAEASARVGRPAG